MRLQCAEHVGPDFTFGKYGGVRLPVLQERLDTAGLPAVSLRVGVPHYLAAAQAGDIVSVGFLERGPDGAQRCSGVEVVREPEVGRRLDRGLRRASA